MAAKAITDSTERSMWPAMMQNDRPIAIRPTKVACCRMLRKMPSWKKCSMVKEKMARMIARITQTRLSSRKLISATRSGPRARSVLRARTAMPDHARSAEVPAPGLTAGTAFAKPVDRLGGDAGGAL
jgi:hypothetical protein